MSSKNEQPRTHEMRPGDKLMNEMTESEFDEAVDVVLTKMRNQYPAMTMGDLQSIAQFVTMFKTEHFKTI